jgi:glutathione synthase/RimK-type ligase-like ATP-grasp enzyme
MRTLVVVDRTTDWPLNLPGTQVVTAHDYLTQPVWAQDRGIRVFNLCRSYRYQTAGYYVSLLAVARRHRPFPGLMTLLDMKSRALVRTVDEELDASLQRSLSGITSERFELSVYFGKNVARRHERLAQQLFQRFQAPLLRAVFQRGERWRLASIGPLALKDVPAGHEDALREAAREYFERPHYRARSRRSPRFDLAILHDPAEELAPSNSKALRRFRNAAEELGFGVEMIQREDYPRIAEFDALFIRETTFVNHHTFRFAQRAESEGLVVVDDPQSIVRCSNKVFQCEALGLSRVPTPRTLIAAEIDVERIEREIGLPCVLKSPDSAFSLGVKKCNDADELRAFGESMLTDSDLVVVQEYIPTAFDWRVGVFAGQALYACRYHMAAGHWQIVHRPHDGSGYRYGRVEPVPVDLVPRSVLRHGLRAAKTMGDGLYGVDLKQLGGRVVVTEVNDNPNLDAGCEDALLGDELYHRIIGELLARIERKKQGA